MSKKKTILFVAIALVIGIVIGVAATIGLNYNKNEGSCWIGGGIEPTNGGGAVYSSTTYAYAGAETSNTSDAAVS